MSGVMWNFTYLATNVLTNVYNIVPAELDAGCTPEYLSTASCPGNYINLFDAVSLCQCLTAITA